MRISTPSSLWRCSSTPFGVRNLSYSIDGDLVEMFLELDDDSQAKIAASVSAALAEPCSPAFLVEYLQDLRSKHCPLCSNKQPK